MKSVYTIAVLGVLFTVLLFSGCTSSPTGPDAGSHGRPYHCGAGANPDPGGISQCS